MNNFLLIRHADILEMMNFTDRCIYVMYMNTIGKKVSLPLLVCTRWFNPNMFKLLYMDGVIN